MKVQFLESVKIQHAYGKKTHSTLFFQCEGGGKHFPFGSGLQNLSDGENMLGLQSDKVCQLPVSSLANDSNDSATPLCLSRPVEATTELYAFERLARIVAKEIFHLSYKNPGTTQGSVKFEENSELFDISSIELSSSGDDDLVVRAFSESGALQLKLSPEELKSRDPKTGEKIASDDSATKDNLEEFDASSGVTMFRTKKRLQKVVAESIGKKASVGYEVVWNDGTKFIYSRRCIAVAAGGKVFIQ